MQYKSGKNECIKWVNLLLIQVVLEFQQPASGTNHEKNHTMFGHEIIMVIRVE